MRLPIVALLLLGAIPSVRLITDATPVPIEDISLRSGLCSGPKCQDLRHNLPRAPPAPKAPEEGTPGGRPIDDPNSAPAMFGGNPEEASPFGGTNEPTLGRPGSPGGTEGAPAGAPPQAPPEPQALALPNPPEQLKHEFSSLLTYLSPGGGKPLLKDKVVMYSGDMLGEASAWVAGRESDGYTLMESAIKGWESPSKDTQDLGPVQNDIQSGAFAASSSGEVRVFLPEQGLKSESVFTRMEWPQMVATDAKVTEIIWVDDIDGSDVGAIWTKDQGTVPFVLNKPIADMIPE